jgi:hypothetical protein
MRLRAKDQVPNSAAPSSRAAMTETPSVPPRVATLAAMDQTAWPETRWEAVGAVTPSPMPPCRP